ncbi:MAG: TonB family protein [Hyphomicrobiales bacterium]|nr:TonB family protein [Hyphomicrobiales bacterium]
MTSPDASLRADALDRPLDPAPPSPAERRRVALALIAAAVLHVLIPVVILVYYALWPPRAAPTEQEIPIEVVVEPPPKPKPPEDRPQPPPQPDDERPAYDAPSAATAEQANRESPDKKTQSPRSKPEPTRAAGAPQPSEQPAAARRASAEDKPAPEAADADAEASVRAATADAKPSPSPAPKPPPEAQAGTPLPSADTLPAYEFAHAATKSPVGGGNADTRYFTIVYGMIRSHFRETRVQGPIRGGAIVFTVDEGGNLVQRKVISSSGSPGLDMAMMTAIAEAAPYPAPPDWQPRSMRLTFGR